MTPTVAVAIGEGTFAFIMVSVSLISLVASAIALYVGNAAKNIVLQFKLDLSEFRLAVVEGQTSLVDKLDERYLRRSEHDKETAMSAREEDGYRVGTREKIKDLEIEVEKAGGSLIITLNNMLKRFEERK